MATFEEQIEKACDAREIPGVVLLACDKTGKFQYQKALGMKSPTEKMNLDATFIMASCTKLFTSIAALQCVEKGQIGLDDDVSPFLTELKDLQIITGFDEMTDKPTFVKAENKITLRHLLTHTSGFSYVLMHPDLTKWRTQRNEDVGTRGLPMLRRISIPLLFEPGTSWSYGASSDWAGLLVMRLNNCTLEEYMQSHIFNPLNLQNITFHQELKPNVRKELVKLSAREGIENPLFNLPQDTGKPVEWTDELLYDDPLPMGEEYGGQGLISSAQEYFQILTSILLDDGKLLKSETVKQMFEPQLTEEQKAAQHAFNDMPFWKDTFASLPAGTELDWGLAGRLVMQDLGSGRKKGTLTWSGLPNLLWTIDREAGLVTFWASNLVPFGDLESGRWQRRWEEEMYRRAG